MPLPSAEIATPVMSLSQPNCPYCGKVCLSSTWKSADEEGRMWPGCSCVECGTYFLYPAPSDTDLAQAYDASYYGGGGTKFVGILERLRDAIASRRARKLARILPQQAHVLDIGCGDGRLLRQVSRTNCALFGVELPGKAAERAAAIPGIRLHQGTLETARYADGSFDLITLVHVIEHLPDPAGTLSEINRILRPGGWLFLSFPNICSWQASWSGPKWFHLDPPRHISLIPPTTITAGLQRAGFSLVEEKHFCAEQNIYGWIQSLLNCFSAQRNLLYEALKRNGFIVRRAGYGVTLFHASVALAAVIPSLLLESIAASLKRGATVSLLYRKNL